MRRSLLYTFSLLLLLVNGNLLAQDSTKVKQPIKSGPQIYLDYGKLITYASDFEQKIEFGVGYQLKMGLQPNFTYGMATIKPEAAIENGEYTSDGTYWRAGVNYLIPVDATSSLFLGVKYGQSKFDDKGSYKIESELWDTYTGSIERSGFEAHWFELIIGSEKALGSGKHIILGGQTGVRFINERDKADFIDIYTIPGYGLTSDKSSPFLNLYIKYQF